MICLYHGFFLICYLRFVKNRGSPDITPESSPFFIITGYIKNSYEPGHFIKRFGECVSAIPETKGFLTAYLGTHKKTILF